MDPIGIGEGIGRIGDAAAKIVSLIAGDKASEQQAEMALKVQSVMAEFNLVQGQIAVDQAEAASSDRLQHWRGALGWVCAAAYAWQFVLQPILTYCFSVAFMFWNLKMPPLPSLDVGALSGLTMGMLGLGAMHVVERVKGAT